MAKPGRAQFRAPPKKCVYCREPTGKTRDHVPPKSLFFEPLPRQLITVPACHTCNGGFSDLDTAFKEWLGFALGVSDAEGDRYWREKVLPTVWNNKRRRQELLDRVQPVKLAIPNRVEPVEMHVLHIEARIQSRMIARLVRGLWFKEHKEILSPDIPIRQSIYADTLGFEPLFKECQWRHFDDQFRYGFRVDPQNPGTSYWFFLFHSRHFTVAFTGAATKLLPDDDDDA